MHWVCHLEVQGLYAAIARKSGLIPEGRPAVVLRRNRVYDGCRDAFAQGLMLGTEARQALRDVPGAALVEIEQMSCTPMAQAWWDESLAFTPYLEPDEPHQVYLPLLVPGEAPTAALRHEVSQLVEIAAAHGFVAFAGVASSKLVARAAGMALKEEWLMRKPGGRRSKADPTTTAYVLPGEERRFLAPLPITYLPVPEEVKRKLLQLGIRTAGEAAELSEYEWLRQLGPVGRQVSLWSRGVDRGAVLPRYPARQLTRRVAFAPEVHDRDTLERTVNRAVGVLARQLADKGEGCQRVALTLEYGDRPAAAVTRTLAKLQQGVGPIGQVLQILLEQATEKGVAAVAAVTVELGLIGPMPWKQLELWENPRQAEREANLERALALLHQRFPTRVVGLGPRREISWKEQMLQFNDPYRFTKGV